MDQGDIRWKQRWLQRRFSNFRKAFAFLEGSSQQEHYSVLEAQGLIQCYEYSFELAWNCLKDWMAALENRNRTSHTFNA